MKTYYQQVKEHEAALLRAQELRDNGLKIAQQKYDTLVAFYNKQYDQMVKNANKELEKSRIRSGVSAAATKKGKKSTLPSNTVPPIEESPVEPPAPLPTAQKQLVDVFSTLDTLFDSDTQNENTSVCSEESVEENKEESEEEDEWDLEGMSDGAIHSLLLSRQRNGIQIPTHLLHYLEKPTCHLLKKKINQESVIIPEEDLTPLPPPSIYKVSPQIEKRKAVKQVKGVHSYSVPIDG
jgi:hypothetical protein